MPAEEGRRCGRWPLAVCTWSLRADVAVTLAAVRQVGLNRINLALKPALADDGEAYLEAVRTSGVSISATTIGFPQEDYTSLESIRATGGIVPDQYWPENRRRVERAADITAELKVPYLTLHAGFLEDDDPVQARRVRDRLMELADMAGQRGLGLLLETGQESAACLREMLEQLTHPVLGVNFDPANMILYDKGVPVEAVRTLGPWIKHVHIKDAIRTKHPGTWGSEVPWGEGEVGNEAFVKALREAGYTGTLAIEREAGDSRRGDIQLAAERLVKAGRLLEPGEHP
jgi:sugar phosphate isomerase/epimerase